MFFTSDRVVHGESTPSTRSPSGDRCSSSPPTTSKTSCGCAKSSSESGLRLHNYKHIETRKNLHLDKEGRAFVYLWSDEIRDEGEPGRYREVDPQRILKEVLRHREG